MDEIDKFIKKIKDDKRIGSKFTNRLLHDTGEVFLKYGFSGTKLFLYEKKNKRDKYQRIQADQLLHVLSLMAEIKEIKDDRVIGKMIFNLLNDIKKG